MTTDRAGWTSTIKVEKWFGDTVAWARGRSGLLAPSGAALRGLVRPDEVVECAGNVACNAGINRLEDLLIGAGGQALTNTWARIGVGDSGGAAAATDTDFGAAAGSTHRWFQAMDATFPSRSSQTLIFKATFASGDGNFPWNEWGIDNGGAGSSTSGNTVGAVLFNHKGSAALGTKLTGNIWAATATVIVS